MSALAKTSEDEMTVAEFHAFAEATPGRWELVDGCPVAMAPTNRTHGAVQSELGRLIGNALLENGAPCSVITKPGVLPHIRADVNLRIPDLAVICGGYRTEQAALTEPVVLIEILSPHNKPHTWANVWAYTTIPSVKQIAVVQTEKIGAKLLRRLPDGAWPTQPEPIEVGDFGFESIGVRFPIAAAYRTTRHMLEL
jgi:Uma2 family endonuclease